MMIMTMMITMMKMITVMMITMMMMVITLIRMTIFGNDLGAEFSPSCHYFYVL